MSPAGGPARLSENWEKLGNEKYTNSRTNNLKTILELYVSAFACCVANTEERILGRG